MREENANAVETGSDGWMEESWMDGWIKGDRETGVR